ncbi:hypothetical protein AAE478_005351 [Parahypoxylon ruwenzoriense]
MGNTGVTVVIQRNGEIGTSSQIQVDNHDGGDCKDEAESVILPDKEATLDCPHGDEDGGMSCWPFLRRQRTLERSIRENVAGQEHSRRLRSQPPQTGFCSSHFFLRARHLRQPVFTRLPLSIAPGMPKWHRPVVFGL